jgi:hypothetical protein
MPTSTVEPTLPGVKELRTVDEPRSEMALAHTDQLASLFERLAKDPAVDVVKLEKIIDAHERIVKAQAKADFDAAFATMQGELPLIAERGEILVRGALRSKFARYEDIIEEVRPVLSKHGFSLRHRNEYEGKEQIVIGILSHRSGHSEQDVFRCPPDDSGEKSSIQAMGSTRSYGQRYTTIALLGIATRGLDDDGNAASQKQPPPNEPDGYENWLTDLNAAADNGWPVLSQAWNKSKQEFRDYLTKTAPRSWDALKTRAQKVGKS